MLHLAYTFDVAQYVATQHPLLVIARNNGVYMYYILAVVHRTLSAANEAPLVIHRRAAENKYDRTEKVKSAKQIVAWLEPLTLKLEPISGIQRVAAGEMELVKVIHHPSL